MLLKEKKKICKISKLYKKAPKIWVTTHTNKVPANKGQVLGNHTHTQVAQTLKPQLHLFIIILMFFVNISNKIWFDNYFCYSIFGLKTYKYFYRCKITSHFILKTYTKNADFRN